MNYEMEFYPEALDRQKRKSVQYYFLPGGVDRGLRHCMVY